MFKQVWFSLIVMAFCFGLLFAASPASAETVCTPTGYYRDNINLTAAYINVVIESGTVVDATGCHIGVYYDDSVTTASLDDVEIFGASYFGVVVDASEGRVDVNIKDSSIHNIGDIGFTGAQHGVAIYYAALNGYAATGNVENNVVYAYQKGGIAVNGADAYVIVRDNVVTGLGPVDFIAQNGIQFGWEANGKISGNEVSGNYYLPETTASAGILLVNVNPADFKAQALRSANDLFENQYDVLLVSSGQYDRWY